VQSNSQLLISQKLMAEFADQTGLTQVGREQHRYLWTDAFAVCNFLELYRQTGGDNFKSLALQLVDQVHHTLGRHRQDDARSGWISGLDEDEGRLHPTAGGLRIGKKLNERSPSDPFDDNLEWDRDGQYYHYLMKWMHALNCVSMVTADPTYNRWARELAKAVHPRFIFTHPADGRKYLHWKMSIDLSRPLVPAMGQHDPLDGLITYSQLQGYARADPADRQRLTLDREIKELAAICKGQSWATDDPLGIGGLLCGTYHLAQMVGSSTFHQSELLEPLLVSTMAGLDSYATGNTLALPADYRLAFRELGLAIGLHATARLKTLLGEKAALFKKAGTLLAHVESLTRYQALAEKIESFWLEDSSRRTPTWLEHQDINTVMLATSLAPDGFLFLAPYFWQSRRGPQK
jgi:hypothetical protein